MKKNLKHTVKLIFPWLILGFMLTILHVNGQLSDIVKALKTIKPQFLGLSLLLIIAYWISEASILMLLLNRAVSFKRAFGITLAGQFFNGITPFASGGQPAQLYLLHKNKVALGKGASVLTKKFITYQAALVVYGFAVLIFEARFFKAQISNFLYLGIIGFVVNFTVILLLLASAYRPKFIKKWVIILARVLRKRFKYKSITHRTVLMLKHINEFHDHMRAIKKEKYALCVALLISFVQLTLFFMIPIAIGYGFQLTFSSLLYVIGASAFVAMVTAFIPLPGAALGAEGSFYVVFQLFFPANLIVTTLLLWRIITYYLPIAVGGMVIVADRNG